MKYKKIHFVGIKGAGMTPLAVMAKEAGIGVTGSDIADVFITDEVLKKKDISVFEGFDKNHAKDADLVIATGAHGGLNNMEVQSAKRRGIDVIMQGEAVGMFMEGGIFGRSFTGISVAGTAGKTTTTAMIATILKENGLDPSYLVGTGLIPSLGLPGHYGKGKYFVAEADEYATEPKYDKTAKFLWQHPKILVITNIEFDHPDVYSSISEVRNAFLKFANQLPRDGLLITCGEDQEVRKMLSFYKGKKITYGFSKENDYVISKIRYRHSGEVDASSDSRISNHDKRFWTSPSAVSSGPNCQNDGKHAGILEFKVARKNQDLGTFYLNVFGEHNVLNATASIIASMELGLNIEQIKRSLLKFTGSKRRSEYIGQLLSGGLIFDDYAHHPTKIKATLSAFRKKFPTHKIVCIFQPHTYSRTKSLFEQFSRSFNDADTVILTNIYASLREKKDPTVSSERLADAIRVSGARDVVFLPKLDDVVEYVNKMNFGKDTIIITMGAGDIYKINSKFEYRNPKQYQNHKF